MPYHTHTQRERERERKREKREKRREKREKRREKREKRREKRMHLSEMRNDGSGNSLSTAPTVNVVVEHLFRVSRIVKVIGRLISCAQGCWRKTDVSLVEDCFPVDPWRA